MRSGGVAVGSLGAWVGSQVLDRRHLPWILSRRGRECESGCARYMEVCTLLAGLVTRARRRCSGAFDVSEDPVDYCGIGYVGDDAEGSSAKRAMR